MPHGLKLRFACGMLASHGHRAALRVYILNLLLRLTARIWPARNVIRHQVALTRLELPKHPIHAEHGVFVELRRERVRCYSNFYAKVARVLGIGSSLVRGIIIPCRSAYSTILA